MQNLIHLINYLFLFYHNMLELWKTRKLKASRFYLHVALVIEVNELKLGNQLQKLREEQKMTLSVPHNQVSS